MTFRTTQEIHPLVQRWPSLGIHFNPLMLGKWPTALERVTLQEQRGDLSFWVKREDRSSRLYGGNKLRKLEWVLAGRPERVVTVGPLGSHHVLATALHAGSIGARTAAVLVHQPLDAHHSVVNRLIHQHTDEVITLASPSSTAHDIQRAVSHWSRSKGTLPLFVPPGGSSPLGTLGFVGAGLEIAEAIERGTCEKIRRIYVPLGTGGTAVGLALGLAASGQTTEVIAVRVASRASGNMLYLSALAQRTRKLAQRAGVRLPERPLRLRIDHRFIGDGYAVHTPEGDDALVRAHAVGLKLESTYSAKTFAAMLFDMRADSNIGSVLFVDTYGPIDHLKDSITERLGQK